MTSTTKDQEFLQKLVEMIVNNPSEIEISREVDDKGVLLSLKVSKEDMGKIIGKEGQTVKSIRTLLRVIGSKYNEGMENRVNLKIIDPEGQEV